MDKVSYSFVKDQDNIIFRSKVKSFNLDHVTDKDIASFYTAFSDYSYFDTGLLPLDGTGLLGVRKAGNHTQVIYQYKPGMYYVNWGAYEKDSNYTKYYFAQPYRIVIIDFLDNNLLGARTFYAVEPAIHSNVQLYHVNLPNINCQGYRGNAVGWICLYHNEDWSKLPFNERLNRALERCSGVEVYNDANMSETDGPRFYEQSEMPDYTYSPTLWEKKSAQEGWEWTLNPSNWIPVKVRSIDSQTDHYANGIPLTLLTAITGNYQAYYTDTYLPKPINAITRPDLQLPNSQVVNWFVQSYNTSSTTFSGVDPYAQSQVHREHAATIQQTLFDNDEEEEDSENESDEMYCPVIHEFVSIDSCGDKSSTYQDEEGNCYEVCESCVYNNDLIYAKNTMKLHSSSENLHYQECEEEYYYLPAINSPYRICPNCDTLHISLFKDAAIFPIWQYTNAPGDHACSTCIASHPDKYTQCSECSTDVPHNTSKFFNNTLHYDEDYEKVTCESCLELADNTIQTESTQKNLVPPSELIISAIQDLVNKINSTPHTTPVCPPPPFYEQTEEPF